MTKGDKNKHHGFLDSIDTPLNKKAEKVAEIVSKIGIVASVIAGLFFIITYFVSPQHFPRSVDLLQVIFDAIIYGIIIVVVAVPEGLPLAVSLSIAFCYYKIKRRENCY